MSTLALRARGYARQNPYLVWLTGCVVYFFAMVHRASLGIAGPQAMEQLGISSAQLGSFVMLQLGIYAVMQVPSGLIVDRIGPRRALLAATIIMGTAQVIFAFATGFPAALLARAMLGVGDSAMFLSVLRLAAGWFPRRRYPTVVMLTGLFGFGGNLAATLPLALVLDQLGWVRTFALLGAISILCSLLLLRPAGPAPFREDGGPIPDGEGRPLWRRVPSDIAQVWRGSELGAGAQVGFWTHAVTMTSVTVISMVWGFPYLTEGLGYSETRAAGELSLLVIVTLAMSFLIPPAAGRWPQWRIPMVLAMSLALLLAWAALLGWPGGQPPGIVVTLALCVMASGPPTSQVGFHLARDYTPSHRISTATGMVIAGGFLGAMIGCLAVGLILDARSGSATPTLTDYRWGLGFVAGLMVLQLSALVVSLLRLRHHSLVRGAAGLPVVTAMTPQWWDAPAQAWARRHPRR